MTHRRRTLAVAITGIVAVAAAWWVLTHRAETPAPALASPAVERAVARTGSIAVTVPAVGRLGASGGAQTKLAFTNAGHIAAIDVQLGQRVVAGETVARLDTTGFALAAHQAQAQALAANAQARAAAVDRTSTRLAVDRSALARASRLYRAGVSARKDVEAARAQLAADEAAAQTDAANREAAQAQAAGAAAQAASAERDLSNTALRAPASGVVTALYHNPGEYVDPGVAVLAIAPPAGGSVVLEVAGADALRIARGDIVHLHVSGAGETLDGRVAGVAGAVDTATQSAQVSVAAAIPAALAGSAVDASIVVAHDRGVLIPREAIVADPATGATLVFALEKNGGTTAFVQRAIHVVFQNDASAEVTGLAPGTAIAAKGAFELLAPAGGG